MSRDSIFDRSATRAAVDQAGLTACSRKFVANWLSAWQGHRLPSLAAFSLERLQNQRALILVTAINPGMSAEIVFAGQKISQILDMKMVGRDWFSLVPPRDLAETMQRTAAVMDGALIRTIRDARLKQSNIYSFETISVPLCPDEQGVATIVTYFDWRPPDKKSVLLSIEEITRSPARAEFISIARTEVARSRHPTLQMELGRDERARMTSQASVRFVINFMREAMKAYSSIGLDPTDYLIVITIDTQNVAHIHNDPVIGLRYASTIAPDWLRRGISRAAVSRVTQIPLETVRRRINHLIGNGVLTERRDGIIVPAANRIAVKTRMSKMRINAKLVRQLIDDLAFRGIPLA